MNFADKPADSTGRKPYAAPRIVCYGNVKDIIQGGGGKNFDFSSFKNTKSCWVAEALYGVHDPRTTLLRAWLSQAYLQKSRWWLFAALYRRCGRTVANLIHRGHLPRRWLRPLFDFLVDKAFDESARAIKAAGH